MNLQILHRLPRLFDSAKVRGTGLLAKSATSGPLWSQVRTVAQRVPLAQASGGRFFMSNASPAVSKTESVLQQLLKRVRDRQSFISIRSNRTPHRAPPLETLKHVSFLDRLPKDYVFWGIIGLNGLVYLMWNTANTVRIPSLGTAPTPSC